METPYYLLFESIFMFFQFIQSKNNKINQYERRNFMKCILLEYTYFLSIFLTICLPSFIYDCLKSTCLRLKLIYQSWHQCCIYLNVILCVFLLYFFSSFCVLHINELFCYGISNVIVKVLFESHYSIACSMACVGKSLFSSKSK